MFTTNFDNYSCVNDRITCTIGKYTFVATIHHDLDSNPNDFECYSEDDIARWKNDEWFYVGIVLSCKYNDIPLECNESLWGIECNIINSNSYLSEVANDLLSQYDYENARKEMLNALN